MKQHTKSFGELSTYELHMILKERVSVFVVEQNCPYQEVDEIDITATHLWFEDNQNLIAYARIYLEDNKVHFGRVLVKLDYREQKCGRKLLTAVFDWIQMNYPKHEIEIEAQVYLEKFYQSFGLETVSEPFLEDNILHVKMRKTAG